jgi:hypothetical protein
VITLQLPSLADDMEELGIPVRDGGTAHVRQTKRLREELVGALTFCKGLPIADLRCGCGNPKRRYADACAECHKRRRA